MVKTLGFFLTTMFLVKHRILAPPRGCSSATAIEVSAHLGEVYCGRSGCGPIET